MLAVAYETETSIEGHVFLNSIVRQQSRPDLIVPQLRLVEQVLASAVSKQRADIALNRAGEPKLQGGQVHNTHRMSWSAGKYEVGSVAENVARLA